MNENKNTLNEQELNKVSGGGIHESSEVYRLVYKCGRCGYLHNTTGKSDYKPTATVTHLMPNSTIQCSRKNLDLLSHELM